MSQIDPYTQPLPQRLTNQDGTPSQEFLQWLIYDNRFKHDIWAAITQSTGTYEEPETVVATSSDGVAVQNYSGINELFDRVLNLESIIMIGSFPERDNPITKTSNYTAAPYDDITAKNGAVITIPSTLGYNEYITVRNGDGSRIEVYAGGTKFRRRGLSDKIITARMGTALVFKYKADSKEYVL